MARSHAIFRLFSEIEKIENCGLEERIFWQLRKKLEIICLIVSGLGSILIYSSFFSSFFLI